MYFNNFKTTTQNIPKKSQIFPVAIGPATALRSSARPFLGAGPSYAKPYGVDTVDVKIWLI